MSTVSTVVYNSTSTLGQASTKSLTHINPDAGNGVLEGLASRVNALSTNIYGGANRIDKTDLDAESPTKTTPTLTLGRSSAKADAFYTELKTAQQTEPFGVLIDINYSGDGVLHIKRDFTDDDTDYPTGSTFGKVLYINGAPKLCLWLNVAQEYTDIAPDTFTVLADESDTCNAASVTFTITN